MKSASGAASAAPLFPSLLAREPFFSLAIAPKKPKQSYFKELFANQSLIFQQNGLMITTYDHYSYKESYEDFFRSCA
jgi:hypothetical protein